MKIGILGTGIVGTTIGSALIQKGHQVKIGSRSATNENAQTWSKKNGKKASHGTFQDAALFGSLVFNCTLGMSSLEALRQAGAENLKKKILIDVSNPLDFSKGMPPTLSVCNSDSLGEQIQKALPETFVVKTLNTMNCKVMVNPGMVKGKHDVFICGNDSKAKKKVRQLLENDFGWKIIHDLGDITSSRGTEMMLPVWIRLWSTFDHADFNFHIVKNK